MAPHAHTEANQDDIEAIVTLTNAEMPRIHAVAKTLTKKGFKVSNVLESSGLIAGHVHPRNFAQIRAVKGVKALEASGRVDIGPPDSDVQ